MKLIIVILFVLLTSNYTIGQSLSVNKTENIVPMTSTPCDNNTPVSGYICPSSLGAPAIQYYRESTADHSYSFTGICSGATEYEWHVQPESNVEKIYYRGNNEILVIFKTSNMTTHIVCRAKCNGVWSEYTVGSVNITF